MASLTQEARERKAGLRAVLKVVVGVKTALSALERLLRRLISRKRDLPTLADLAKIAAAIATLDDKANIVVKALETLRNIFQF